MTSTDTVEEIDVALGELAAVPYRRISPEAYAAWVRQVDRRLDQRLLTTSRR